MHRFHSDQGHRRPPIALPDGARVCFTVDMPFEGFEQACQYTGRPMPDGRPNQFSLSFAEYGLRVGVWRLLELFEKYGITGSAMTNGYAAQRYPKTLRAVHEAGHEIVGHGWTNDAGVPSLDVDTEQALVVRVLDAIETATGRRPVGWLSPGNSGSDARLEALVAEGLLYSCDDASDDLPYVVDVNGQSHVIVPRTSFGTNDLDNWFLPRFPISALTDSFIAQFRTIYSEAERGRPGWVELVVHSQFAGRPQAVAELEQIVRFVLGHAGVWVAPRVDLARWILDNPDFHT